ncbi:MAG: thiamine-phosphate kinase [Nitrososphaeria archaeon]|nr:thiamine-phosphate kinase [Nitrososphaeria archaeon]NIN52933.1 thiamine-phosphate kinase [Nitrososphaeria archaeon]NIQ33492.1 thiamine-phosphate kinase [Nitrososphaeria archaeon]
MILEREIINLLARRLYQRDWKPNDVAQLPLNDGRSLICSIDTLVSSTDIPPGLSLRYAARKAAVSVISDFASKGVGVDGMLLSLSLPPTHAKRDIEEIGRGLSEASREYGFKVLAGDTNEASDLVITCCGLGFTERSIPNRGSARVGDTVVTTGLFGLHALGLEILLEGIQPKSNLERLAVQKFTSPMARVDEGGLAVSSGAVTASIDSSDGLLYSLYEIAEHSDVKISIDSLPAYPGIKEAALRYGFSWERLVLGGGEEYELIFTVIRDRWEELENMFSSRGLELLKIGRVEEGSGVYLIEEGMHRRLERTGWEHFGEDRNTVKS